MRFGRELPDAVEERCTSRAERLVQAIAERMSQQLRVARGDRRSEQHRRTGAHSRVGVRHASPGERCATRRSTCAPTARLRSRPLACRRRCAARGGPPSRHATQTPPPSTAARLSMCDSRRSPSASRSSSRERVSARRGSGDEAEPDRRRARAEPRSSGIAFVNRNRYAAGDVRSANACTREMRRVARQLVGPFAVDLDGERRLLDLDRVPEVERRGRGVEPRADVRGRRRRSRDDHASASSTASSEASTMVAVDASTAPASLRPWPVTMQTAVDAAAAELGERGDSRRRRRLAEHPSTRASVDHAVAKLGLRQRHDGQPSAVDQRVDALAVRRLGDPDRRCERRRPLGRLADDERRGDAGVVAAGRDRGHVAAAAVGERDHVGDASELLDDLADHRPLAVDPVRVQRVDEHEAVALAELTAEPQRVVERAADLDHLRAGRVRLRALRACGRAFRRQHDRAQARRARRRSPPRRRCCPSTRTRPFGRHGPRRARPRRPCRGP